MSDECSCARCQHPALDSNFGFRDARKAEDITRHMARGRGVGYHLIRSHMGIWYFLPAPSIGSVFELLRQTQILSYLGCEVVKTFDSRGDEVPR